MLHLICLGILIFMFFDGTSAWSRLKKLLMICCGQSDQVPLSDHDEQRHLIERYRWLRSELSWIKNSKWSPWDCTLQANRSSSDSARSPVQTGNAQFLPGFLLGDTEIAHESFTRNQMSPKQMNISPRQNYSQPSPPQVSTFRRRFNRGAKTVLNGPPTASLFDEDMKAKQECEFNNSSVLETSNDRMEGTNNENAGSQGYWIVVYGFPPSARAQVLSLFSQLGQVIEHSFPTSGNWMFLKLGSRGDVRKALTYNERTINGNIMIGVSERINIEKYFLIQKGHVFVTNRQVNRPCRNIKNTVGAYKVQGYCY